MAQLEATPEILRALLEGITAEDAQWKPAPDRFSVAEVLEHLSHAEGHCYRARLDATLASEDAPWEPYRPEEYIAAGQYSGRDAEDSFDHWEDQREDNLALLRDLPPGAAERSGMHISLGRVKLAELIAEWAFHDLGHIRQIAELIRARKCYPHMGPFQRQVKVNP